MPIASLVFAIIVLFLIGVGIAVGLVACGLAVLVIGWGVISSSYVVGIRSGRPADGIRVFLLQCGIIAGVPAGAVCAWAGSLLLAELNRTVDWPELVFGGLAGALAGVLVALAINHMSRHLHGWAAGRLHGAGFGKPSIQAPD